MASVQDLRRRIRSVMNTRKITKAANAQVTAAFHAYIVGDRIFFTGVTGMTQINGRTGTVVSVIDASNFTVNINSTAFSTFIASSGIVRGAPPTPVPAPTPPPVPPIAPTAPAVADSGGTGSDLGETVSTYDRESRL